MKQVLFIAALMGALFLGTEANAQGRYKNTNDFNRNKNHYSHTQYNKRMQHGVRNGSLTKRETAQLRRMQMRVNDYKRMAMADGVITPRERRMIRNAQQQANYAMYAQKHDRQRRY